MRGKFAEGDIMEAQLRFLGICILIAAVIIAAALVYHGRKGRYQLQMCDYRAMVLDTVTGEITQ